MRGESEEGVRFGVVLGECYGGEFGVVVGGLSCGWKIYVVVVEDGG